MHNCNIYFRGRNKEELSFADQCSKYASQTFQEDCSSFIASQSEIPCFNKDKGKQSSPLHNLHLKYLPAAYRVAQFDGDIKKQKDVQMKVSDVKSDKEGMDQIRKKINFILSSIDDQQKRELTILQKYPEKEKSKSNHHKSMLVHQSKPLNRNFSSQLFQTPEKMISKKPFENSSSSKNLKNYSNLSEIQVENRFRTPLGQYRRNEDNLKISQNKLLVHNSTKRSVYSNCSSKSQSKEVIVKGKNINEEIDKLQEKIKSINKIKNNLNIKFEQKAEKKKSSPQYIKKRREPLMETQLTNLSKKMKGSISNFSNFTVSQDSCLNENRQNILSSGITERSELQSNEDIGVPNIMKKLTAKKKKKGNKQNIKTQYYEIQKQNINICGFVKEKPIQKSILVNQYDTFRPKSGTIVKNQKNILQSIPIIHSVSQKQTSENDFKKFLNSIENQIKLDEKFRKAKQWFNRLKVSFKWDELQMIYNSRNQAFYSINKKTKKQLMDIFTVSLEEENPFYQPEKNDFSIEELIDAFVKSEDHWNYHIKNQFSFVNLEESKLNEENIDLRKRGFISIEDLLRFFNAQLDVFFRNRDIILIYQRMKISDKLFFTDIKNCLQK